MFRILVKWRTATRGPLVQRLTTSIGPPSAAIPAELTDAAVELVSGEPEVVAVVADRTFVAAAEPPQVVPSGVDRVQSELSSTASGDGRGQVDVDVAIVDGGFEFKHPDLDLRRGAVCIGRDFHDSANIVGSHGTEVAGVVGALDNGIGVVGVAPGARLWAVEVFRKNFATLSSVLCGIDWVLAHADVIEVVNMSFGGPGPDDDSCGRISGDPLHQAICALVDAGVTVVASAGNEAIDASEFTPAGFEDVIAVSALVDYDGAPGGLGTTPPCWKQTFASEIDDSFAFFSNYGSVIDLIAPGVCVLTTTQAGQYALVSGTSFSAPHANRWRRALPR